MGIKPTDNGGARPGAAPAGEKIRDHGIAADTGPSGHDSGDSYNAGSPGLPARLGGAGRDRPAAAQPVASATTSVEERGLAFDHALRAAAGNDPQAAKIIRIRILFSNALDHLRGHFKPEEKKAGTRPAEKQITAALRNAYYNDTGTWPSRDNREIGNLVRQLILYLETYAEVEGLVGRNAPKQGQARKKSGAHIPGPEDAVRRAFHAARLLPEIKEFFNRLREDTVHTFRLGADSLAPIELLARAEETEKSIRKFGANTLEMALAFQTNKASAIRAAELAGRMWEIRNEMRLVYLYHTSVTDHEKTEYFMNLVRADLEEWLKERVPDEEDKGPLRLALKSYIAHWLSRQTGDMPLRLTFSDVSLEYAIIGIGRGITDDAAKERFLGFAPRLIHSVVRQEARKSRLPADSPADSTGAPALATPQTRQIKNLSDMAEAIGPEVVARFSEFYEEVRANEDGRFPDTSRARAAAGEFFELFFNYVRYFANTYGDNSRAEIARRGIELPLLHAIFERIEGARNLYDDEALKIFREFFARHVREEEPELKDLRPPRQTVDAARHATESEIPYDTNMGMREFAGGMLDAEQISQFERELGVRWNTFLSWGGIMAKPGSMSEDEWRAHVEDKVRTNSLEDVTTEPRAKKSLDAILPAYFFLQKQADKSGRRIDFFDYLSAIYPVARRLRAMASDGTIHITVPEFMRNIPYRNWGYATFARTILLSKYATEVVRSTIENHLRGDVDNPEYDTIRRYAAPLALSGGGGIDGYTTLYHFAAGFMRWAYLTDSAIKVYDGNDSLLTHPADGAFSRFGIQLEYDNVQYAPGSRPQSGTRRSMFMDARLGRWRNQLDLIGDYLAAVRLLPEGTKITSPDGKEASLDELDAEFSRLDAEERSNRAVLLDRSATSALRSEEDNEEIYRSYQNIREFVGRVAYFTRIRGSVDTANGPARFQAVFHQNGRDAKLIGGEFIALPIDDLAHISASGETQRRALVEDVIRLRAIAGLIAAHTGTPLSRDPQAVRDEVFAYWPKGRALEDALIDEFLRLEEASDTAALKPAAALLALPRTSGHRAKEGLEPFLPLRAGDWRGQFDEFARERGLPRNLIAKTKRALEDYFSTTKGFYHVFYPEALKRAIAGHISDTEIAREIFVAANDFFRRIAVASDGTRTDLVTYSDHRNLDAVAQAAAFDYLAVFPESADGSPEPVPIDLNLLSLFVTLILDEHRELMPRRSAIIALAREKIEFLNREWAKLAKRHEAPPLKIDGMMAERLRELAAAWRAIREAPPFDLKLATRAYFHLLPSLRQRVAVGREEVANALAREARGREIREIEIDFLEEFMRRQAADIEDIIAIIEDGETGIASFVGARRSAHYVSGDGVRTLAITAAVSAITENTPFDAAEASRDAVPDAFEPYEAVAKHLALSHGMIFRHWLEKTVRSMASDAGDARAALAMVAEDEGSPAASYGDFLRRVAGETQSASFEDLARRDRALRALTRLNGGRPEGESLDLYAARLYEAEVVPRRARYEEAALGDRARLEEIADRAVSVMKRSAALFTKFKTAPDIAEADETALKTYMREGEEGMKQADRLRAEIGEILKYKGEAQALAQRASAHVFVSKIATGLARLASITGTASQVPEDLDSAFGIFARSLRTLLEETDVLILESHERAGERAAGLKKNEDAARMAAERAGREQRLSRERSEIMQEMAARTQLLSGALDAFSKLGEQDLASLSASLYRTSGLIDGAGESFAAFHAAGAEISSAIAQLSAFEEALAHAQNALANARDGKTPGIDSIIARARTLESPEAPELGRAIGLLDAIVPSTESALQAIDAMAGSLAAFRASLTGALEMEERNLPVAEAAGIPEGALLPQDDFEMGQTAFFRKPHRSAQSAMAQILEGRVISRRDGARLIKQDGAHAVERWKKEGRGTALKIKDVFGNEIVLQAGERGIRLFEPASLPGEDPFKKIDAVLRASVAEGSPVAEVLARLGGSGARSAEKLDELLGSLLATAAASPPSLDATDSHALVRRWMLAKKDSLAKAIAGGAAGEWFAPPREVAKEEDKDPLRKKAGGPLAAGRAADSPSPAYKMRIQAIRTVTYLIDHPEIVLLNLDTPGGQTTLYVNALEVTRALASGSTRILRFDVEQGRWEETDVAVKYGVKDLQVAKNLEKLSTLNYLHRRTAYSTFADPTLARLSALMLQSQIKGMDGRFDIYFNRLLMPIEMTTEGREPPYTWHEAQRQAFQIYNNLFKHAARGGKKLDRVVPFVELDAALAGAHPETGHVSSFHYQNLMRRLTPLVHKNESRPAMAIYLLMSLFPEYAGAITIIEAVSHLLPAKYLDALISLAANYTHEKNPDASKEDYRRQFLDLYHSQSQPAVTGHDAIIRALETEKRPGMTHARWLTGHDMPWKNEMPPLEQLAAIVPEFRRVKPELIAAVRLAFERISEKIGYRAPILEFMDRLPGLSGALVLETLLSHVSEELRAIVQDSFEEIDLQDRESAIENFVRQRLSLEYMQAIRNALRLRITQSGPLSVYIIDEQDPSRRFKDEVTGFNQVAGMTAAHFFTGDETPWRPDFSAYLLPPSDAARIGEMTEDEIGSRIDALGFIPDEAGEFRRAVELYLRHHQVATKKILIRLNVREEDAAAIAARFMSRVGLALNGIEQTLNMRLLLAIYLADPNCLLDTKFTLKTTLSTEFGDMTQLDKSRFIYSFILENKDAMIAAYRKTTWEWKPGPGGRSGARGTGGGMPPPLPPVDGPASSGQTQSARAAAAAVPQAMAPLIPSAGSQLLTGAAAMMTPMAAIQLPSLML